MITNKNTIHLTHSFPVQTMINSVDHHPSKKLFVVTFTHANKVVLYQYESESGPMIISIFQYLSNPLSQLVEPQHSLFSPNGQEVSVINWTNGLLSIYNWKGTQYDEEPSIKLECSDELKNYKPHGMAYSHSGKYLVVA